MSDSVTRDKLVRDIREVISDTEVLLKETANDLGSKASEVRKRLAVKLEDAKSGLKQVEHAVKFAAAEGAKKTDKLIREHPYESIGLSFGVGLLFGFLISRR